MIEVPFQSINNPGSFDLTDKTNPLYYIARAAHEESLLNYYMVGYGLKLRQESVTDVTNTQASLETYITEFTAWTEYAVQAQEEGIPVPALPSLPAIPGLPFINLLLPILLRVGVRLAEIWLRKKLDGTTDASELVSLLRKALMANPGEVNEYPILDALANQAIELWVNTSQEQYDISIVPSVHQD